MNSQMVDREPREVQLSGRRLRVARLAWVAAATLAIALALANLLFRYEELQEICTAAFEVCDAEGRLTPDSVQVLHALDLSLELYALYTVVLSVIAMLVWSLIGIVIFMRKSNDWMALLASVALVVFGSGFPGLEALPNTFPWGLLTGVLAVIAFTSIILFLYLFPSGRFAPRWARWFAWAWIVSDIFSVFDLWPAGYDLIGFLLFFVPALVSIGAQIYRYRRVSDPAQQRQTKWVLFGIVAGFGGFLVLILITIVIWGWNTPQSGLLIGSLVPLLFLALPLSIGMAISRSKLWDIDIIIRKTLVYTLLTALLALVFFGSVTLLQSVVSSLTGQQSALATVLSTLAIAALFTPLRRRIQIAIDRRFYRRKYDAQQVLAAFAQTARDEVTLEALTDQLQTVVAETMQPHHVSVWLVLTKDK